MDVFSSIHDSILVLVSAFDDWVSYVNYASGCTMLRGVGCCLGVFVCLYNEYCLCGASCFLCGVSWCLCVMGVLRLVLYVLVPL